MPDAAPPTPVTSAHWSANVRQQVVAQLDSGSLPAAGTEGRMYAVTNQDRYAFDTGAVILPGPPWASAGRVGLSVSRVANQSIPTGTGTWTSISWDTEAFDSEAAFTPHATTGTQYVVPANRGGLWSGFVNVVWATSPGANSAIRLFNGGTVMQSPIGAGTQMTTQSLMIPAFGLFATQAVEIQLSQGSGGAINVVAAWQIWRISA